MTLCFIVIVGLLILLYIQKDGFITKAMGICLGQIALPSNSTCSSENESDEGDGTGMPDLDPQKTVFANSLSVPPPQSPSAPGLPRGIALRRTATDTSVASSLLSRLSVLPSISDPLEHQRLERQKHAALERKTVRLKIAEFHATVTGAVFYGTVKYASGLVQERTGGVKHYLVDISPKHPPASPKSPKHAHFANFANFYNNVDENAPLECFFDVFLKKCPAEDARITFLARPTEEEGNYWALACNIVRQASQWINVPAAK